MGKFLSHTVNQRFRAIYEELDSRGIVKGKSDLAKNLDTYNHVINNILKGTRNITLDQLYRLIDCYKVNANYCFGISDVMFREEMAGADEIPSEEIEAGGNSTDSNIILVEARVGAGLMQVFQDDTDLTKYHHFSIPKIEGQHFAFRVSGDSMMPTINDGDMVVCELLSSDSPIQENHVYVVVSDTLVVKRIQQIRENSTLQGLRLISDNNDIYQPYQLDIKELRHILKVKCRVTNYGFK